MKPLVDFCKKHRLPLIVAGILICWVGVLWATLPLPLLRFGIGWFSVKGLVELHVALRVALSKAAAK